jgi:cell cycle arrest protein BUB2
MLRRPMKLLRNFPPLRTREIIPLVVLIPATLYDAIVRHPWDDTLVLPIR